MYTNPHISPEGKAGIIWTALPEGGGLSRTYPSLKHLGVLIMGKPGTPSGSQSRRGLALSSLKLMPQRFSGSGHPPPWKVCWWLRTIQRRPGLQSLGRPRLVDGVLSVHTCIERLGEPGTCYRESVRRRLMARDDCWGCKHLYI